MSPALNGSSALERNERDNTQRNNVRFLPGTVTYALHGKMHVHNIPTFQEYIRSEYIPFL